MHVELNQQSKVALHVFLNVKPFLIISNYDINSNNDITFHFVQTMMSSHSEC